MNKLAMPSTVVGGQSLSSDTICSARYSAAGAELASSARRCWARNSMECLPFTAAFPRAFDFFKFSLLLAVLLAFGLTVPAFAQTTDQTQPAVQTESVAPLYPPNNEFGMWGGYSVGNSHVFGTTSDRQLGALGFRYGRTIYDAPSTSLQYTLDIVPVETLRQFKYQVCSSSSSLNGYCSNGRETVYGGGISPLGLKLNFRREHQFQPFIASTAGFVASVRPIPVDIPGGTQFNFTFDFQAGMDFYNSSRNRVWRLGYKYQHISNAYRHSFNPGVDVHVIWIGYSFLK
ncbi:MAG: acyloxyacyl hydrolase [Candidatus Acidiferrales bacterium]